MTKKLKGITLLEAMLALAIATTVILLGLKNYVQYKRDRDAFALKYNVDRVFQAMRDYYYANCANPVPGSSHTPALAPGSNPPNPFPVDMSTTLANYLPASWHPENPLIARSFGHSGYAVQFNQVSPAVKRNENFCYFFPNTTQTSPSCNSLPNNSAIIYLWVAQIVVQVQNTAMTLALQGMTGADCALASYSPPAIVDCSTGATSGNPAYLVWQRLPSFASPQMSSGLWGATPAVKQFNLQYTNDSLGELVSATYAGSQYYLCGG